MEAIDTSVLVLRQRNPVVAQWFEPRLRAGTLAICDLVVLEYLAGAAVTGPRSGGRADGRQVRELPVLQ